MDSLTLPTRRAPFDSVSILIVKHTLGGEYSLNGVAEDVERFLLENGCRDLRVISFPLNQQSEMVKLDRLIINSEIRRIKKRTARLRPPLSFAWQVLATRPGRNYDVVIGFNPAASVIAFRAAKRSGIRVTWRIDFVPPKSRGAILGSVANAVERSVLKRTDVHIENSALAMQARSGIHPGRSDVTRHIAPVAAWPEWYATSLPSKRPRKIVFLGGINVRTGSSILQGLVSNPVLARLGISFEIIGGGSDLDQVRWSVHPENIRSVVVHGPVKDEATITAILAESRLALAPYASTEDSFTEFADPGKLKRYLAAGLPILTTEVPAIAQDLSVSGGAEIIQSNELPEQWLLRVSQLIDNDDLLDARSREASRSAENFLSTSVYNGAWTVITDRLREQRSEQRGA